VFLYRIYENPMSYCPSAITKDQTGIIILRDLNACLAIENSFYFKILSMILNLHLIYILINFTANDR